MNEKIKKFLNNKKRIRHPWRNMLLPFACTVVVLLCISLPGYEARASMPEPVTGYESYIRWLQATGRPAYSRYNGYAANYEVYRDYQILSYGTPQMVPNNRYDEAGHQYAIHGFSYDEYTVTNTYFRDDTTVPSDPRNWNNIDLGQDAAVSWMRLSSREKEHIKASQLFYSGRPFGMMTFSSLGMNESKCVVIAVPSWNLGFALHTKHYNSRGELRYGTLNGNGIGGVTITGSIHAPEIQADMVYSIPSNQDYSELTVNVNSSIQSYSGLARPSDIATGGIIINQVETESQGSGPWFATQKIRLTRESADPEKDYSRLVTVNSTVWVVSASGDLVSKDLSYTFTLIEKAKVDIKGIMTIKGAISLFNGKQTIMGYRLPLNTKRFLCLEKIVLQIDFNCATVPNRVIFMPVGTLPIEVDVVKTGKATGYARADYTMGIIPSTITWSNNRVRPSYYCSARAIYGDYQTAFFLDGIEITGDIFDLVYLQSVYNG